MRWRAFLALLLLALAGCEAPDDLFFFTEKHYFYGAIITNVSDTTPTELSYNASRFEIQDYRYDVPGEFPISTLYGEYFWVPGQSSGAASLNPLPLPNHRIYYWDMASPPVAYGSYRKNFSFSPQMYISYSPADSWGNQVSVTGGDLIPVPGVVRNYTVLNGSFLPPSFDASFGWLTQSSDFLTDGGAPIQIYQVGSATPRVYVYRDGLLVEQRILLDGDAWVDLDFVSVGTQGNYTAIVSLPYGFPIYNHTNITMRFVKNGGPQTYIPQLQNISAPQRYAVGAPYALSVRFSSADSVSIAFQNGSVWDEAVVTANGTWFNTTYIPSQDSLPVRIIAHNGTTNVTYEIFPVALSTITPVMTLSMQQVNLSPGKSVRLNGSCGFRCPAAMINITAEGESTLVMANHTSSAGIFNATLIVPYRSTASIINITARFPGTGRYAPAQVSLTPASTLLAHDAAATNMSITSATGLGARNVTATVWNTGANAETFPVSLVVQDQVVATQSVTLASKQSQVLTFAWQPTSYQNYTIKVSPRLATDMEPSNDNATTNLLMGVNLYSYWYSVPSLTVNRASIMRAVVDWAGGSFTTTANLSMYVSSDAEYDWLYYGEQDLIDGLTYTAYNLTPGFVRLTVRNGTTLIYNETVQVGRFRSLPNGQAFIVPSAYSYGMSFTVGNYTKFYNTSFGPADEPMFAGSYTPVSQGETYFVTVVEAEEEYDSRNDASIIILDVKGDGPDLMIQDLDMDEIGIIGRSSAINTKIANLGTQTAEGASLRFVFGNDTEASCMYAEEMGDFEIGDVTAMLRVNDASNTSAINITVEMNGTNYTNVMPVDSVWIVDPSLMVMPYGVWGGLTCVEMFRVVYTNTTAVPTLAPSRTTYVNFTWIPQADDGVTVIAYVSLANDIDLYSNSYRGYMETKADDPDLQVYIMADYEMRHNDLADLGLWIDNDGSKNAVNVSSRIFIMSPEISFSTNEGTVQEFTAGGEEYNLTLLRVGEYDATINISHNGSSDEITIANEEMVDIGGVGLLLESIWSEYGEAYVVIGNYTMVPMPDVSLIAPGGYAQVSAEVNMTSRGLHYLIGSAYVVNDSRPHTNHRWGQIEVLPSGRDVAISDVSYPGNMFENRTARFWVELSKRSFEPVPNVTVLFKVNGTVMDQDVMYVSGYEDTRFDWTPLAFGLYNITIEAVTPDDTPADNVWSRIVGVRGNASPVIWMHDGTGRAQTRNVFTNAGFFTATGTAVLEDPYTPLPYLQTSSWVDDSRCEFHTEEALVGPRNTLATQHLASRRGDGAFVVCANRPSWTSGTVTHVVDQYSLSDNIGNYTGIVALTCERWNFNASQCASGWVESAAEVTDDDIYVTFYDSAYEAVGLRKEDIVSPDIIFNGWHNISNSSSFTINVTINDSTLARYSLQLDNRTSITGNTSGTIVHTFQNLTIGLHRIRVVAVDGNDNAAAETRFFTVRIPLNATEMAQRLSNATGANVTILRSGTVATLVNDSDPVSVNITTANGERIFVPTFTASTASWEMNFTLTTDTGSGIAAAIGSSGGGAVANLVFLEGFDDFINGSSLSGPLSITFPGILDTRIPVFIEDDAGSSVWVLPQCGGNIAPAQVRNRAAACYTNGTNITLYLPHFSGGGLLEDDQAPVLAVNSPSMVASDSEVLFNITVTEANPAAPLCNYSLKRGATIIDQDSLSAGEFTQNGAQYDIVVPWSGLLEGDYFLNVSCADAAGRTTGYADTFTVADITDPVILIDVSGTVGNAPVQSTLSVEASEAVQCSYGPAIDMIGEMMDGQSKTPSASLTFTASEEATYYVQCTDINGRVSGISSITFPVQVGYGGGGSAGGGGRGYSNLSGRFSSNGSYTTVLPDKEYQLQGFGSVQKISFVLFNTTENVSIRIGNFTAFTPLPDVEMMEGFSLWSEDDLHVKSARATFILPRSIAENAEILLFEERQGSWRGIATQFYRAEGDNFVYVANLPDLGNYVIAIKQLPPVLVTGNAVETQSTPLTDKPSGFSFWWMGLVAIGAIVAVYIWQAHGTAAVSRDQAPIQPTQPSQPSADFVLETPAANPCAAMDEYIEKWRKNGKTDEQIAAKLRSVGWREDVIQRELRR